MIVQRLDRCEAWRVAIDERLDLDDSNYSKRDDALRTHLARCDDCRTYDEDLRSLRTRLRGLPDDPLPRETLERIWARTIDTVPTPRVRTTPSQSCRETRPEARPSLRPLARVRAAVAVAAMLAVTSLGAWFGSGVATSEYTEEELARIDDDLRTAMAVLSLSLSEAEHIAIDDALAGGTASALRHMPLSRDLQPPSNGG